MLQTAQVSLEDDGVIETAEIQASDLEGNPWADTGHALRNCLASGRLPGLHFQSHPVFKCVTPGFADVDQYILGGIFSVRVLDGGIDLAEDAEIVQRRLRVEHVFLAQGAGWSYFEFSMHHVRTGVHETRHKYLVDKKLLAFLDAEGDGNAIGSSAYGLGRDFQ